MSEDKSVKQVMFVFFFFLQKHGIFNKKLVDVKYIQFIY